MANIAVVEKNSKTTNWEGYFETEVDYYQLTSNKKIQKITKSDIDIQIDTDKYDYVICVGADATKYFVKNASVTSHQGSLLEGKFIPIVSPNMLKIRPEGKSAFERAIKDITAILDGTVSEKSKLDIHKINDSLEAKNFLTRCLDQEGIIAVDTETTALYSRKGYTLGISLAFSENEGAYISSLCIDEECEQLLELISKRQCVFHNAKFDKHFLLSDFLLSFDNFDDTQSMHYILDENNPHGLKDLAIKYTDLGDYDRDLITFKKEYCKKHKIKVGDFTYDLIPFDILGDYAAIDAIATLRLYNKFYPIIARDERLTKLYNTLMIDGTKFLFDIEENGIPIDREYLSTLRQLLADEMLELEEELYSYNEVKEFEKSRGGKFNPRSPAQVVELMYGTLNLPIVDKKTDYGAYSMDDEVLTELAEIHDIPAIIQKIKKNSKIKSTYVDKISANLDSDDHLRTNYNLHVTTSGRLSSSGVLNAQTMPRDDKRIKRAIKARPGRKIVSQDLKTAEVFIAACLANDTKLLDTFKRGEDFHGFIAKTEHGLSCTINEVKRLYPDLRQEAKSFSFRVLYALDLGHPVLRKFPKVKAFLKEMESSISDRGYCYTASWRKRRLPNVFSSDKGLAKHYVRSGVNALVQSVASDINLKAGIELNRWIKKRGYQDLIQIFMLVHDSIVAEVHESVLDEYNAKAKELTQIDWFNFIPDGGYKIGVDVEIGDDYSFTLGD